MKLFNLYRLGRYGYFHVTSGLFESKVAAMCYYAKNFGYKITTKIKIGSYKVTGL